MHYRISPCVRDNLVMASLADDISQTPHMSADLESKIADIINSKRHIVHWMLWLADKIFRKVFHVHEHEVFVDIGLIGLPRVRCNLR